MDTAPVMSAASKSNSPYEFKPISQDAIRAAVAAGRQHRAEVVAGAVKGLFRYLARGVAHLVEAFEVAVERERAYRRLTMMDDAQLAALGIARADIPAYVMGRNEAAAKDRPPVVTARRRIEPSLGAALQAPSAPLPAGRHVRREVAA